MIIMMWNAFLVFIGSGIGGALRYLISRLFAATVATSFPLGTITVNIVGCFIIGLVNGLFSKGQIGDEHLRLMLTVGFCGGFTTFSSFINESFMLMQTNEIVSAVMYMLLSIVFGFIALMIGYAIVD